MMQVETGRMKYNRAYGKDIKSDSVEQLTRDEKPRKGTH